MVLFTALIIALSFSWAFRLLLQQRGTNVLVALVLVLLAASASMIHFLARPHVVSWLFTVAWFWILERERSCVGLHPNSSENSAVEKHRDLPLWLLPLLMLAWVNVHGGFLVGFVLLAIYWISDVWQWFRMKGEGLDAVLQEGRIGRRVRALTWSGILSALATLVNPYGFRLHLHIYRYLSNRFLMDHIDEFQSPNFHYVAQKCFAGLLLLTLVALVAKRREMRPSQTLVVLVAVYSGLYASRNIPVSSLLLILVIGPWLSDAMELVAEKRRGLASVPFLRRMGAVEVSLRGHLWPVAAVALSCWVAAHGGRLGAMPLMEAHFDAKRFPVAAVNYLEKQDVQGPLVSPDSWGGYPITGFIPECELWSMTGTTSMGRNSKSYLKMVRVEPGWDDFLQQHPARCVLVPKDSALANILAETTGWKPIYGDDVTIAFARTPASQ